MKVEYINPFLVSTISTFKTMLACVLTRGAPYIKNGSQPEHDVSGVIGLSGKAQGTVVVGLGREAALKATKAMIQERPPEINGNVVERDRRAGEHYRRRRQAQLENLDLSVSLPSVITGKGHCIQFPTKVTPICIPFDSDWGPITVEVGLSEPPATP